MLIVRNFRDRFKCIMDVLFVKEIVEFEGKDGSKIVE